MPWGVPTAPRYGTLDEIGAGDFAPSSLPIMGAEEPVAPITANGAIQHALKPSPFGQGGIGRNIAGYIGDALQRMVGGQATFAPMMMRMQEQSAEDRRAQARLHAQALQPFHIQDADGNVVQVDPSSGKGTVLYHGSPKLSPLSAEIRDLRANGATDDDIRTFVHNKVDPPQVVATTDALTGEVRNYRVPSSQFGRPAASGPPPDAVAHLRAHPELQGDFDAKYGSGAAAAALSHGGPAPQGPGTFPRPR